MKWTPVSAALATALAAQFSATSLAQGLSVGLPNQQLKLEYPQPVRLEQVLNDAYQQLDFTPFAPANRMTSAQVLPQITAKKEQLLQKLAELSTAQATELALQLKKMNYSSRVPLVLDRDTVRVSVKDNPMLEGEYRLLLSKRPEHISVIGLVPQPKTRLLHKAQSLDTILENQEYFSGANITQPWIIQPDGTVTEADTRYWHQKRYYLAPGAIIFIGFEQYPDLNKEVAELLRYAVVKQ